MDKFDKIIKEKVEQFEVPYNDAHWAEMEGKLNSIHSAKIKKNIITAVGIIAVLCVSSYIIISNTNTSVEKNNNVVITNNQNTTNGYEATNNTLKNTNSINSSNEAPNKTVEQHNSEETNTIINNNETTINNETIPNITPEKTIPAENNENTKSTIEVSADFIVYNNTICLGEVVSFEALEKNSAVSYLWDFGDGTNSKAQTPKHTYEEAGNYTVSLKITSRQSGIEYKSSQKNVVTILPTPNVDFTYTELSLKNDNNKLKYPYTSFEIKGNDVNYTYSWELGNGKNAKTKNAKTIYDKAGNYNVALITKTENGCSTITTKNIVIKNGIDLYAPTGFKPNTAVSSESETFIPMALLGWEVQFNMTILDNAGKTVYKTSDRNAPWNGKMNNNGQLLNEGVYVWQVIVYDAEGIEHAHKGNITLLK
jgi:PKD repeat protein